MVWRNGYLCTHDLNLISICEYLVKEAVGSLNYEQEYFIMSGFQSTVLLYAGEVFCTQNYIEILACMGQKFNDIIIYVQLGKIVPWCVVSDCSLVCSQI